MWRQQATELQEAVKLKHEDNSDLVATHKREASKANAKHEAQVAALEEEVSCAAV